MPINEKFHKDMTAEEVRIWFFSVRNLEDNWRHVISHMETKFEEMQREIVNLKLKIDRLEAGEEKTNFKVGWVYENHNGNKVLIGIIKDTPFINFPILAFNLTLKEVETYTGKGYFFTDDRLNNAGKTLLHCTGKKWEPED